LVPSSSIKKKRISSDNNSHKFPLPDLSAVNSMLALGIIPANRTSKIGWD
jgi:hypothetical protein